ncbi:MAG: DNA methyltransferase [Candidatus Aenigmatarchaeota archaeon]
MGRFIFIKGKNPVLSKLELESYFQSRCVKYSIVDDSDDFTIIDAKIDPKMIDSLGGTLKIAELITECEDITPEAMKDVEKMISARVFGLSVYAEKREHGIYKLVGKTLKENLRENGVKAKYLGFSISRRPQMSNVELIKRKILEESVEVVVCYSDRFYIGVTRALHNPFEYQKRDMERPEQRPIFSIPPRLANILINLSGAKPGDLLLDPFCGIGTILQEAALRGMRIAGIDKDPSCVEASKINLHWLSEEYKLEIDDGMIGFGDATRLSDNFLKDSVDAIATEPYLGPPLRGSQRENEVRKIFRQLEPMYAKSLRAMGRILKKGKRVAIISPCIRMHKGKAAHFEFQRLAKAAGFKIIESVIDAEKRHVTQREIFIIEKR